MWLTVLLQQRTDKSHNLHLRELLHSNTAAMCPQQWDLVILLLCDTHLPDIAEDTDIQLHLRGLWWCSPHQQKAVILERFWDGNFSPLLLHSSWPYVPWGHSFGMEALYFKVGGNWAIYSCNPKNWSQLNNTSGFNLWWKLRSSVLPLLLLAKLWSSGMT